MRAFFLRRTQSRASCYVLIEARTRVKDGTERKAGCMRSLSVQPCGNTEVVVVEHLHCTHRQLGAEDFCTVRPVKEGSRGLYADQPGAAYDQEALKKMKENASM